MTSLTLRNATTTNESIGSRRCASAREYATKVRAIANTASTRPLYSNDCLRGLADFLWQPYVARPLLATVAQNLSEEASPFVSLYHCHSGDNASTLVPFANIQEFDSLAEAVIPLTDSFAILLFQGYPSAEWISTIGARFDIAPEFFQQHLATSQDEGHLATRILPSRYGCTISLPITSVGIRHDNGHAVKHYEQEDLDRLRKEESARMDLYTTFHQLKHGHGWLGIIWYDGENQSNAPLKFPWTDEATQATRLKAVSVTSHKPGTGVETRQPNSRNSVTQFQANTKVERILQNIGGLVDFERARRDPFYATSPLFELYIASDLKLLQMLDDQVKQEVDHYKMIGGKEPTLSNLLYNQQVLKGQIRDTHVVIGFLESLMKKPWIAQAASHQSPYTDGDTVTRVLCDCRATLNFAESLVEECNQGMTIVAHNATIQESRKAMSKARGVTKLTQLAFVFVPASFVTAVFSMGVRELNMNDGLPIWTWVLVVCLVWLATLLVFKEIVLKVVIKSWSACKRKTSEVISGSKRETPSDKEVSPYRPKMSPRDAQQKAQPWKAPWLAMGTSSNTEEKPNTTSHGFSKGEEFIMDGNMKGVALDATVQVPSSNDGNRYNL
ncbi:hypothetical protein FCIRC_2649 [Fusarium circinatum]|uniref:Uncharacterized protein n=1 Tax=Fusarium circinatum TaxID=48490 RepID=A0A8H5X4G4_FUSCI|nr:hypothetical protein FCIRC_2649 [Fusarium circinatum]